jgi:hypothetical protein
MHYLTRLRRDMGCRAQNQHICGELATGRADFEPR